MFKHSQELARGYLAHSTPTAQHSTVFGRFNSASSVGFIVGPTLGGHLASRPQGYMLVGLATGSLFLLNTGRLFVLCEQGQNVKVESLQSYLFSGKTVQKNEIFCCKCLPENSGWSTI